MVRLIDPRAVASSSSSPLDTSGSCDPLSLAESTSAFHAAVFCPAESRLVATANHKAGVQLYDVRRPLTCVMQYGGEGSCSGRTAMSVRFNGAGTRLLALRRRLPPVLFDVFSPSPVAEFDHPGYYNSCTMKSCSFGGTDDEYVMSGSDDFNLYVWRVPSEEETSSQICSEPVWVNRDSHVLRGHRSIVNQVRFNKQLCMIASAGVEKVIKLWGALKFPGPGSETTSSCPGTGGRANGGSERQVYSRLDYLRLVVEGESVLADADAESTEENPRMMAFFDTLVQREMDGLGSSDEDGTSDDNTSDEDEEESNPRPCK